MRRTLRTCVGHCAATVALAIGCGTSLATTASPTLSSVYLEDLTWTELRAAVQAGTTTAIIPVGGTEQSGPYVALGKHNVRARLLAGRIAAQLGDALVAPVVAYVPEGAIDPPTGHMRLPGTLSVSDAAFVAVLEGAANSLRHAGFTEVVLLGDHGGYQAQLRAVAARLSRDWHRSGAARIHCIDAYYEVTQTTYVDALRARGLTATQIGVHAGAADTALMLALDPSLVRPGYALPPKAGTVHAPTTDGINGDPRPATAALGQLGVDLVVMRSVAEIRRLTAATP